MSLCFGPCLKATEPRRTSRGWLTRPGGDFSGWTVIANWVQLGKQDLAAGNESTARARFAQRMQQLLDARKHQLQDERRSRPSVRAEEVESRRTKALEAAFAEIDRTSDGSNVHLADE